MAEEVYARLSKAGQVLCGRPDVDGRFHCDGVLARVVAVELRTGFAERRLIPLDGWVQDKRGIWHETTRVTDLRRHGRALPTRLPLERMRYPDLPVLARCPKCATVQWLAPERLRVSARPNRWCIPVAER